MFNVKTAALFAFAAVAAAGHIPVAVEGGAAANQTVVTTTKVVQAYTTYCPEPTTLTLGAKTYTVTEPITLTITDCPCTIVEPCHDCHHPQPTGPVNPPPPPPPANNNTPPSPPPVNPPPVLVSGASERLIEMGTAILGAVLVGALAL